MAHSRSTFLLLLRRALLGINCCVVALLWGCAASAYINPSHLPLLGVVGLLFPFCLLLVLATLVVSLLMAPRLAIVPAIGLLVCSATLRAYFPINLPHEAPQGSTKVVTYNVAGFALSHTDSTGRNDLMDYLLSARADILCLQESNGAVCRHYPVSRMLRDLREEYPHVDTTDVLSNVYTVASRRYPIVRKEGVCRHGNNGASAFYLLRAPGDTLLVVNCHLESMHLSLTDRAQYAAAVRAPEEAAIDSGARLLVTKIARASVVRAQQAQAVAAYVEQRSHLTTLVCGDFNDSPVSYTRNRIARTLHDAYARSGTGLGRSFRRDAIFVRIDHILSSPTLRAYGAKVDTHAPYSDHAPLSAYFTEER